MTYTKNYLMSSPLIIRIVRDFRNYFLELKSKINYSSLEISLLANYLPRITQSDSYFNGDTDDYKKLELLLNDIYQALSGNDVVMKNKIMDLHILLFVPFSISL